MLVRSRTPVPVHATRAATSALSSVFPATTTGTPYRSAWCTPP
ncbi:Uncharacterised protein [Mycobacteroides abscessus]|nr:Uncharacterised protein [Mycobacteroides abscessus]